MVLATTAPSASVWKQFAGWRGCRMLPLPAAGQVAGPHGHGSARWRLLISTGCSTRWWWWGGLPPNLSIPTTLWGFGSCPPLQCSPPPPEPGPGPGLVRSLGQPQRGSPARENRAWLVTAATGWVFGGDGALQHTAAIQPRCRARLCVNSPGSGPQ